MENFRFPAKVIDGFLKLSPSNVSAACDRLTINGAVRGILPPVYGRGIVQQSIRGRSVLLPSARMETLEGYPRRNRWCNRASERFWFWRMTTASSWYPKAKSGKFCVLR